MGSFKLQVPVLTGYSRVERYPPGTVKSMFGEQKNPSGCKSIVDFRFEMKSSRSATLQSTPDSIATLVMQNDHNKIIATTDL
jgi:hypothetical protein